MAAPEPDPALDALQQALWAARNEHRFIATAQCPALPQSVADAYAVADWLHRQRGGTVAGWKLGATSARAQTFLGLSQPFLGRIYADLVTAASCELRHYGGELALEAEFGLRLGRDLGPDDLVNSTNLFAAVDAIVPLIEINRPSYLEPFVVGALAIVADNGVNAGMVVGEPQTRFSLEQLAAAHVTVTLNGAQAGAGCFADTAENWIEQLAWAAVFLAGRGCPLRAGQVIAMGSCAGTQVVRPGDQLVADFGPWGELRVSIR